MTLEERLQQALGAGHVVQRELGGGGMSRVFVAHDQALGRDIVVKTLLPEIASDVSADRFKREIRLAASLQHANIVPLLTAGDVDGVPFYTMPFVAGESLRDRIARSGPLAIDETINVLKDITRALVYAHEHGVVHRDIKPANVMLSGGAALVTDFGIAKALGAARSSSNTDPTLTGPSVGLGTPAYMSPEQAMGGYGADHRSDIYSLGVLAYEALSGRPVFAGSTPQEVIAAHLTRAPQPISELRAEVPAPLAALVMDCVAKDVERRPASAAVVLRALEAAARFSHAPDEQQQFRRALIVYAASFGGVALLTWAAVEFIGLPDWVLPGVLVILGLGLPLVALTGVTRGLAARPAAREANTGAPPTPVATRYALQLAPHITWRRVAVGGGAAIGVFGVVVAGYMLLRTLGIGPPGTLLAAGTLDSLPRLLITDFVVKSADSSLSAAATDAVRASFAGSRTVRLLDPTTINASLQRMQRPPGTRVDVDVAREIAAREGLSAIVDGEVTGTGGGFIITLRLLHGKNGAILAGPFQAQTSNFIDGIDEVARRLRGKIGEPLKQVRASQPLWHATTSSLEALQLYSEGMREEQRQTRVATLRRAVAIDSTFATAWRSMGIAMQGARFPQASIDTAFTKAYQFRERLSDSERLFAEAVYFGGVKADRLKEQHAYEAILRNNDSAWGVINNLGMVYKSRRNWSTAESLFKRVMMSPRPTVAEFHNVLVPLVAREKLSEAESLAGVALERFSRQNFMLIVDSLRLGYTRGQITEYDRALDSVRTAQGGGRGPITTRANALVAPLRGRLTRAEGLWREIAVLDSSMRVTHLPFTDSLRFAHFDAWYRLTPERAVSRLDAALGLYPLSSLSPVNRPYASIAIVYAQAGRPDKARAVLQQLASSGDTALIRRRKPSVHGALAEILLAEERPREAIEEFRRADVSPDGPVNEDPLTVLANVGRAFDLANEPDSAITYYERYVKTRYFFRIGGSGTDVIYESPDGLFLAGIHKRLGELYEAKGNPGTAASHYSKFIELWQNADPDLQPRVAEARARLARMKVGGDRRP